MAGIHKFSLTLLSNMDLRAKSNSKDGKTVKGKEHSQGEQDVDFSRGRDDILRANFQIRRCCFPCIEFMTAHLLK